MPTPAPEKPIRILYYFHYSFRFLYSTSFQKIFKMHDITKHLKQNQRNKSHSRKVKEEVPKPG